MSTPHEWNFTSPFCAQCALHPDEAGASCAGPPRAKASPMPGVERPAMGISDAEIARAFCFVTQNVYSDGTPHPEFLDNTIRLIRRVRGLRARCSDCEQSFDAPEVPPHRCAMPVDPSLSDTKAHDANVALRFAAQKLCEVIGETDRSRVPRAVYDAWSLLEDVLLAGSRAGEVVAAVQPKEAGPSSGAALHYACVGGVAGCAGSSASSGPCASCVSVLAAAELAALREVERAAKAVLAEAFGPSRAIRELETALRNSSEFTRDPQGGSDG